MIAVVRTYETLYIVDPNLTDDQVQAATEKYQQIVTQGGGEVIAVEKWDKRRLAYEIAGYREGIYILMYFSAEATVVAELDRVMRISEGVIRHLVVLEEAGQAAAAKERALRPAPKPAEAPARVEEVAAEAAAIEEVVEEIEVPREVEAPEAEAAEAEEVEAAEAEVEVPAEEAESPAAVAEPVEAEEAEASGPEEVEAAAEEETPAVEETPEAQPEEPGEEEKTE